MSHSEFNRLLINLKHAQECFDAAWSRLRSKKSAGDAYKEASQLNEQRLHACNQLYKALSFYHDDFLAGNEAAIDRIIAFIEVDVPAFRSGYAKEWYYDKLKNMFLNAKQKNRLKAYALDLLRAPNYRREWSNLCHLLIAISDQEFLGEVKKIASEGSTDKIRLRASRTVDRIINSRHDLS